MNESMSRLALKKEALAQSRLFDSLKGWLKNTLHLTTIALVLALFGANLHPAVQICGWVLLILSILAALIIGLALKRGRDNLENIFQLLENMEA